MPILFHQNMLNFGGGVAADNAAYQAAFGPIAAGLLAGGQPIVVAGFTEVLNNNTATNALNGAIGGGINLSGALGLAWRATVKCRDTAVGNAPEYIGIATAAPPFPAVLAYGRILVRVQGAGPHASLRLRVNRPPAGGGFVAWCNQLPDWCLPDYQGIVYIVVTINGNNVGVGFLHNMYAVNDNRTYIVNNLPKAARLIMQDPAMAGSQIVYICGDFNCNPQVRQRYGTVMTPYAQGTLAPGGMPVQYALTPPQAAAGAPGGTTVTGPASLYDYSYSTIGPATPPIAGLLVPPVPGINVSTLDCLPGGPPIPGLAGNLSDHVASWLRV
jgi:hypothetical protein